MTGGRSPVEKGYANAGAIAAASTCWASVIVIPVQEAIGVGSLPLTAVPVVETIAAVAPSVADHPRR